MYGVAVFVEVEISVVAVAIALKGGVILGVGRLTSAGDGRSIGSGQRSTLL